MLNDDAVLGRSKDDIARLESVCGLAPSRTDVGQKTRIRVGARKGITRDWPEAAVKITGAGQNR
jgi:hypothetical protein